VCGGSKRERGRNGETSDARAAQDPCPHPLHLTSPPLGFRTPPLRNLPRARMIYELNRRLRSARRVVRCVLVGRAGEPQNGQSVRDSHRLPSVWCHPTGLSFPAVLSYRLARARASWSAIRSASGSCDTAQRARPAYCRDCGQAEDPVRRCGRAEHRVLPKR
jgi:hypothetical protein